MYDSSHPLELTNVRAHLYNVVINLVLVPKAHCFHSYLGFGRGWMATYSHMLKLCRYILLLVHVHISAINIVLADGHLTIPFLLAT